MPTITSPHNERVKLVRALQSRGKTRRAEERIVLEGVRLIADVVALGVRPDFILYTADADDHALTGLLSSVDAESAVEVSREIMASMTDTQSPQGILAVVPQPRLDSPDQPDLVLILDGIADPGNLGTMLRTAAAAGVPVVVLAPGCVDPYNPKTLRAGMGAHFRVPIARRTWADISRDYGTLAVYLADAASEMPYYTADWKQPSAIIIGSEAHGPADEARQLATTTLAIPMANAVESVNAAIAAGIILFEIRRQRSS